MIKSKFKQKDDKALKKGFVNKIESEITTINSTSGTSTRHISIIEKDKNLSSLIFNLLLK
jgi:hypothetical protein